MRSRILGPLGTRARGTGCTMSICSEADAFVAACLTQFSLLGARVPGRRPDGGREAVRPSGRDVRAAVRGSLRPAHVRRRGDFERARRVVVALSAAGGAISLLVGSVLLRLTVTGTYRRYVRVEGRCRRSPGVVVLVLGLVTLLRALRRRSRPGRARPRTGGSASVGSSSRRSPRCCSWRHRPSAAFGVERAATIDIRAGAPVFRRISPARRRSR